MYAILNSHSDIAELLLNHRADVNAKKKVYFSALLLTLLHVCTSFLDIIRMVGLH